MTSLAVFEATATILCQFTAWLLWFATGLPWPLKFSLRKEAQKSPLWVRWSSSFSTLYAHRTSKPQKSILSLMLDIAEIKILRSQALYSLKTAHLQGNKSIITFLKVVGFDLSYSFQLPNPSIVHSKTIPTHNWNQSPISNLHNSTNCCQTPINLIWSQVRRNVSATKLNLNIRKS